MSLSVCLLNCRVIGIFVGHEESGFDFTSIGILATSIEHFFVEIDVVVIYGIVKCNCNHHWDILGGKISRNGCSILRAETIGQNAHGGITGGSPIGVIINICKRKEKIYLQTKLYFKFDVSDSIYL